MTRIIDSSDLAVFGERVTSCPKCNKIIAFTKYETFLDLSHGPEHCGEESITCPECNFIVHLREFHTTEHM